MIFYLNTSIGWEPLKNQDGQIFKKEHLSSVNLDRGKQLNHEILGSNKKNRCKPIKSHRHWTTDIV